MTRHRTVTVEKYFMDTHDRNKGSFPAEELTEEQFFAQFDALEKAAHQLDVFGHAAHVNLREGKAFCFMSGPDEEAIRKAHAAIDFPFDSITEVRRVTGADMRLSSVPQATSLTSKEEKPMSVKLLVLYPTPTDPEQFDRRYEREHLPMGKAALIGATGLASHRILGSPAGKSPFARLTEVSFPTLRALQECAALPGAQKTMANAVEISTGGAPQFMIVEQEG